MNEPSSVQGSPEVTSRVIRVLIGEKAFARREATSVPAASAIVMCLGIPSILPVTR